MSHRLLRLLPALLILAAILLPLGSGAWRLVQREPDLRWTVIDRFAFSASAPDTEFYQYGTGFVLILGNEGTAPTAPVRITLDRAPVDLYAYLPDGMDYTESETEEGHVIELSPLPTGKRASIRVWGMIDDMIRSVETGGERAYPTERPSAYFRPEPWLPNWAVLSGAVLLAGLALQNLRMQRELGVWG